MKKFALVLLAGFSLVSVKAQIQFGVKAGANFSTLSGSDADGAKTQVGFNAGALVSIPLADAFSLQPEVVYSAQGAKADGDFHFHLNYVNVPVLIKYSLPVGVFFETGPQIGFLTTAKEKSGGTSTSVKDQFKSTDLAWAFGAGYLIPGVNLGFDARYNLGISKIAKEESGSTPNLKNSVFQVGVFYLFGEKKSSKK